MDAPQSGFGCAGISLPEFQNLIKDRKAERKRLAEVKRHGDLERIKIMNEVTSGIEPLELFPKEIWNMIINELNDFQDQENIYRTHKLFRDLVASSRLQNTLFPQIIRQNLPYNEDIDNFEVDPFLVFRSVSKKLLAAVDSLIEDSLKKLITRRKLGHLEEEASSICLISNAFDYKWEDKQLDDMIATSEAFKPRFFLKQIYLHIDNIHWTAEHLLQVGNKVTSLLKLVGDQILHFCLDISPNNPDAGDNGKFRQSYIFLHEWCSLMPNLKWLFFEFCPYDESDSQMDLYSGNPRLNTSLLNEYPFPRLEHLEEISWGAGCFKDSYDLCKVVLEANAHVRAFTIQSGTSDAQASLKAMPAALIKSLELTSFSANYEHYKEFFHPDYLFQEVMNKSWLLQRLHLTVSLDYAWDSMSQLIRFLQNFQTLKYLTLRTWWTLHGHVDEDITFLHLPNLEEFEFVVCNPRFNYGNDETSNIPFFYSLQFLIYAKMLRRINFMIVHEIKSEFDILQFFLEEQEYSGMVNIWKPPMDLEKSNIGKVFPYLEYVRISAHDRLSDDAKTTYMEKCWETERINF